MVVIFFVCDGSMGHWEGEFQLKFHQDRSSRLESRQKFLKSPQDGFRPPGDNLLALPGASMFRPSVETEKSLDFTAFLAILCDPDSVASLARQNGPKWPKMGQKFQSKS